MTESLTPPIRGFLAQPPQREEIMKEILNTLLEGGENLALKTEIHQPKKLTALKMVGLVGTQLGYFRTGLLVEAFLNTYLEYMISYKRMSRSEIIRALTTMVQEQNVEGFKKLITNMK